MTLAAFNIIDAGVQVGVDGELVRTSPGYAVLDKHKLMVGEDAAGHVKLLPRWTNNRFWGHLDTSAIAGGTNEVRHHADLAFAHLEELWRPISDTASEVIFAVPADYGNEQLGLLLGMAEEAGIPVVGMVDCSVLTAAEMPVADNVLHLDIHLHGITLTRLSNGGLLARREARTIAKTGLATLWERWATIIANQFITSNRFDPLHEAATEQRLFDALPSWIAALSGAVSAQFELPRPDATRSVAVSKDALITAVSPIYPQIVQAVRQETAQGGRHTLLLSPHFRGFPGLKDSLGLIGNCEIIDVPEDKVITAISSYRDEIVTSEGGVIHVTQLTGAASPAPEPTRTCPTHLLWQNHATPLGQSFRLGADLSQGLTVSAEPVCTLYQQGGALRIDVHDKSVTVAQRDATSLQAGDSIKVGGQTLTLITVEGNG